MRCKYCFYADEMEHRQRAVYERMSRETLETVVRRAMAYAEGSVWFTFQGGEPTLAGADFYRELVKLQMKYNARGVDIHNAVQTNGFIIDDELLDIFAEERFLLGVSIDGDRMTHDLMRLDAAGNGTFDRVMNNIARFKVRGIEFNALCVVNKHVAQRPREVFEALEDIGFIQFIPCLDGLDGQACDYSLTGEDYLAFLKQTFCMYYERFTRGKYVSVRTFDNFISALMGRGMESCALRGQCGLYYLIESDGDVYPCDFYALDEWRLGNIRNESFFRFEKSPLAKRFTERSYAVPDSCRTCIRFEMCHGGCPRERTNGGAYRFCEAYKAFFDYAMPRMIEMARKLRAIPHK